MEIIHGLLRNAILDMTAQDKQAIENIEKLEAKVLHYRQYLSEVIKFQ